MSPKSRLFQLLEITTIGYPFCAFKWLTGSVLLSRPEWHAVGIALMGLALVDVLLNAASFVSVLARGTTSLPVCTAQFVLSRVRPHRESWRRLGLAVDAMLSFALVAAVIGFGLLAGMSRAQLGLWNTCVVFNVLGAGLGRLAETVMNLRAERA